MKVTDAVFSRKTVRAFLEKSVEDDLIRKLLDDPTLADLVGQFNQLLPDDIEDATNKEYYITKQGQLVRVVDGEILT